MTFASYMRRERIRIVLTQLHTLIFGGKIFACPAGGLAGYWQGKVVNHLQRVFVSLGCHLFQDF